MKKHHLTSGSSVNFGFAPRQAMAWLAAGLFLLSTPCLQTQAQQNPAKPAAEEKVTLEIKDGHIMSTMVNNANPPATISNLADYLRGINPDLNVVYAPDLGGMVLSDLKLRGAELATVFQGISLASDYVVRPEKMGASTWALRSMHQREQASVIEVFNLSPYLRKELAEWEMQKVEAEAVYRRENNSLQQIRAAMAGYQPGKPISKVTRLSMVQATRDNIVSQIMGDYADMETKLEKLKADHQDADVDRVTRALADLNEKIAGLIQGTMTDKSRLVEMARKTIDEATSQMEIQRGKIMSEVAGTIEEAVADFEASQTGNSEKSASPGKGATGKKDKVSIKFHPGSSLLVIVGNPDAMEAARKVVKALTGSDHSAGQAEQVRQETESPSARKK